MGVYFAKHHSVSEVFASGGHIWIFIDKSFIPVWLAALAMFWKWFLNDGGSKLMRKINITPLRHVRGEDISMTQILANSGCHYRFYNVLSLTLRDQLWQLGFFICVPVDYQTCSNLGLCAYIWTKLLSETIIFSRDNQNIFKLSLLKSTLRLYLF